MTDYGHWNISRVGHFTPKDWYGFVYIITHLPSGCGYIGQKRFFSNKRHRIQESNWRIYCSSSGPLKSLIRFEHKSNFLFEIHMLCSGQTELTYEEARLMFLQDALRATTADGSKKYLNANIMGKFFTALDRYTEESITKRSQHAQESH